MIEKKVVEKAVKQAAEQSASTMMTLAQAASVIPGATVIGDANTAFARVSTDSRTLGPGDLFVALRGERFDAHDFLDAAIQQHPAAVMVSRLPSTSATLAVPALVVPDTRIALGALAHAWRLRFDLPVVAVTGSNGKTTVKEMIASIFASAVGEPARLSTQGNLNNDIGVPLTLFRLSAQHRLAVIELGMNHPDETRYLAGLTSPTVALINNAQREHQEFMRTVEAVALEHASVIHVLAAEGVAVFPADDKYTPIWRVAAHTRQIVDFMLRSDVTDVADAAATSVSNAAVVVGTPDSRSNGTLHIDTPAGAFVVHLRTQGDHNLRNALAATAAALAAGVAIDAIREGLEAFEPVKGRLQVKRAGTAAAAFTGATVIDDSYNANPDSMRAAIDVLAAKPAPRVLIVGDMGEVGDQEAAAHREIGAYAQSRGIDTFFALGEASKGACAAFGPEARHFASPAEVVNALLHLGQTFAGTDAQRATILVKGSRFMAMERIVNALVAEQTTGTEQHAATGASAPDLH